MMNRLSHTLAIAAVFTGFAAVASAGTLNVDPNGVVTGWGVTPFTQANGIDNSGLTFGTIANDYAPINYPGGVGYVPSPGGNTGEKFDLEEMHGRINSDGTLNVLVVTSSPFTADASGSTWHLGDLFVTVGGQSMAVVTQSAGRGYSAGEIYAVNDGNDVQALEDNPRSYLTNNQLVANDYGPDAKVRDVAGPWQVIDGLDAGQKLGDAAIDWTTFDYAGEEGTFLIEYTLDLLALGAPATFDLNLHLAWGCGNDVIESDTAVTTPIPEPASLAMLAVSGLMLLRRGRLD